MSTLIPTATPLPAPVPAAKELNLFFLFCFSSLFLSLLAPSVLEPAMIPRTFIYFSLLSLLAPSVLEPAMIPRTFIYFVSSPLSPLLATSVLGLAG